MFTDLEKLQETLVESPIRSTRASRMLRRADSKGLWSYHECRVGKIKGMHAVTTYDGLRIVVTIPRPFMQADDLVLMEILTDIISCLGRPQVWCRHVSRWLRHSRRFRLACKRLHPDYSEHEDTIAVSSVPELSCLVDDEVLDVRDVKVIIAKRPLTLGSNRISMCDPYARMIVVDPRADSRVPHDAILNYVVFRELCAIAAFDYTHDNIDVPRYVSLLRRWPTGLRHMMEDMFDELMWGCTYPTEWRIDIYE